MWLQKLSKRVLSLPRTQLNSSCWWEMVIWHTNGIEVRVVSWDASLDRVLNFFRRAALDHVFPVVVNLIVTSSGVKFSWIMVAPSMAERVCLSFWNAINPSTEVSGWIMVL